MLESSHNGFLENRWLQFMLALFALVWLWAAYEPVYRFDWFLENILTVLTGIVLILTYSRFRFSDISYGLILLFACLHTVGSHYTYSETPPGFWIQETFQLSRNHYDRIVHFAFGLLLAKPALELIREHTSSGRLLQATLALCLIISISASFEIIEWIVAMIVSPEAGIAYLGTQGDEFDSHKDMALALVGAVISLGLSLFRSRQQAHKPYVGAN